MHRNAAASLLLVLLASACSESTEPSSSALSSARETASTEAASTEVASTPSGWHTIEYSRIALNVPANWTLNSDDPCTGRAIVSPPRVRTSCPPLPSVLISTTTAGASSTGASATDVVVEGFHVSVTGVDAKAAHAILASVRAR